MIRQLFPVWPMMLIGLVLAAGCGPSGPPPSAKASGQVTHKGNPVPEGEIYFLAAEKGYSANASLNSEGKYTITSGLPPATYKVFVTRPRVTAPPMMGQAPAEVKEFLVPDKYQSDSTSGLTAEVKAGDNTFNFPVD